MSAEVQDYYSYDYGNAMPTKPPKEIIPPCDPTADDRLYHICIAAVSLVIMLVLAVLARRKKVNDNLRGFSGLLSPVNFLDHTQHKGLAVAVYGVLFCKLFGLGISPSPLPFVKDSAHRQYWIILALVYYPALYYPLLACGTLHSQVGYVLGSLLSWSHFSVLVWQKVDCPRTPEIYKYYALFTSLPQIACLAFLSFQYPLLLFKGLKGSDKHDTHEDLRSSYYRDYVKKILKKKKPSKSSSSASKPNLFERISDAIKSYIYTPEDAFRFPLKLAISVVVAFISLYQMAVLLVSCVVPTLQIVRSGVDEDIAFLLAGFNIILSEDRQEVVKIVIYYMWCVEVCYISAMTLSCLVNLAMLMRSMVLHRDNLQGLYRGDIYNVFNCQRSIRPSRPALVCWMGFTSYQAAVICLSMTIQTLVFFICLLFAVFLVIIPVLYGQNLFLFHIISNMWPFWLMLILAVFVQHLATRFLFIKKVSGARDLHNRGSLFLMTYLLFPVNVLLGVLLGIWRVVITALFNIIHLGRMDISLLNRNVEAFDPSYRCYAHYLKIEVSQSHPVMKAFCGMLLHICSQDGVPRTRDAEEGIQLVQQEKKQKKVSSAKRARGHWQLLYTLVNNPSLVGSRKHFQRQTSEGFFNGTLCRTGKDGSILKEPSKEAESAGSK
ncbi:receptor for retinol uptake stra6 [Alosa sapidissima]|uniref:receptor for retinol uptake stra6 n=1 Tax=Alosa sapidissima TaxID=34773 RepID=UPI001C08AA60|nr:receptor for retinol uptake stra6 [Alosa sapidissima]XP_041966180.1 receptor for retinol uptake stra6 [Alosa sapidissima]XP_041966181.1 receptor for retinol uptake stra6 [Alosa sapidissima]XP_041966182.1 receptor for retinol uptake stra6 [Alosa sapidissima]XP_041966183.1 receptor for retinol uptake stra6 [Alosa sapidissima]